MSSLMQAVLQDVTPQATSMNEEECLASFDLDMDLIGSIDGAWERVDVGDPHVPFHEDLDDSDFLLTGDPVYERKGFMIVRGDRDGRPVWFVYEPANIGIH